MITTCPRCRTHCFNVRLLTCLACGHEEERIKVLKPEIVTLDVPANQGVLL